MEFHYRYWASFGVGSSVTFAGGAGFMEVKATLQERDAGKVVLRIQCHTRGTKDFDFTETLRHDDRHSFFPARPAERQDRRGREVIVVAGEEWLSSWEESSANYLGRNVTVKAWFVDQVPGGIAQWQMHEQPAEPRPLTWTVKSFVRK
jgi:hypothetical protein